MYFVSFLVFAIISLCGGVALALPDALDDVKSNMSTRSAETCADPSLTQTVYQSFWLQNLIHNLNFRFAFESDNTKSQTLRWADLHPVFLGWPTQQDFTVPLWQLGTANLNSFIWAIGTDAQTPPVISGFNTGVGIVAWVYSSQVCGSVPLMSAALPSLKDRYATTNAFEHNGLINTGGWVDSGVIAFVLPVNNP